MFRLSTFMYYIILWNKSLLFKNKITFFIIYLSDEFNILKTNQSRMNENYYYCFFLVDSIYMYCTYILNYLLHGNNVIRYMWAHISAFLKTWRRTFVFSLSVIFYMDVFQLCCQLIDHLCSCIGMKKELSVIF